MPTVSVIVPNYNHASFLKQRLDTVFEQTYKDFEVIILDDCSTDDSKSIIESYRGRPELTQIIYNERNSGSPFLQWHKGIQQAKGDWIWIAESDDYADLKFLEKLIGAIGQQSNIGLAYCDSKIVSGLNENLSFSTFKNERFRTDRWSRNYINNGLDEIENFLLPGGTINNSSAVLFRRRYLVNNGPFDLSLRYIGDKYAFIRVLAQSDVLYVPESLNFYRDPFNTKHSDKFVFYFYEQFQVFDWVYKNITLKDHAAFYDGFYANTRNSLFRGWSANKVMLYSRLLRLNPPLFGKNLLFNFKQAIRSLLGRASVSAL
jgi:glycosyltransferase involved in cell wall biosynthesis